VVEIGHRRQILFIPTCVSVLVNNVNIVTLVSDVAMVTLITVTALVAMVTGFTMLHWLL
jgi:hypothetical protein